MKDSGPSFDDDRIRRIVALADSQRAESQKAWTPQSLYNRFDEAIIGNRQYKQALAICIADFLSAARIRNHLLVAGPSGTGKTYLLEQCLPDLGIPSFFLDASALVPSGYKGNTLSESLTAFFQSRPDAARASILVLDEFDKLSERGNGGDTFKSQSLQSELLALIQGKAEGSVDTRNALWILAGAFAYSDEMKQGAPRLRKPDLLKYGFKNELLGRLTHLTMTELPSTEEVVRRVLGDKAIKALVMDLEHSGRKIELTDEAILRIALASQNPAFGMRVVPSLAMGIKTLVTFTDEAEPVRITGAVIEDLIKA